MRYIMAFSDALRNSLGPPSATAFIKGVLQYIQWYSVLLTVFIFADFDICAVESCNQL